MREGARPPRRGETLGAQCGAAGAPVVLLPTATDYFYPDFVAELHDGRLLVVEYKGEAYATNDDSGEKRAIGQTWARASTGHGVFLMVEKSFKGMDVAAQLRQAVRLES